jgi:hypothetical protein
LKVKQNKSKTVAVMISLVLFPLMLIPAGALGARIVVDVGDGVTGLNIRFVSCGIGVRVSFPLEMEQTDRSAFLSKVDVCSIALAGRADAAVEDSVPGEKGFIAYIKNAVDKHRRALRAVRAAARVAKRLVERWLGCGWRYPGVPKG